MKKLVFPLLLAFIISGCSQFPGQANNNIGLYYPMCYAPLVKARQLDSRARDVAESAGKGFLLGTLAGLAGGAVSALFTGDPLNIVSGAAIGAAGGTIAGGVEGGVNDHEALKTALIAEWSQETGTPLEGLGFNGAAATASIQCYNKRLAQLEQEVKDGIVTRNVIEPRLVEIELGRQEAYRLLESVAGN